jgi:RimJ/RimL family protein N-acetyltransferase
MTAPPVLTTARLILRPFARADAPEVQRLAGAFAIADTTLLIPHPYEDGMAETWIDSHGPSLARGESVTLAITLGGRELMGAIGVRVDARHAHAELGYWLGTPYWGRGYATEAAEALLQYGFGTLGLHRIFAHHFVRNPASGRVLQKIGMQREGRLREHVRRWERFEDLEEYGILRAEYDARQQQASGHAS